MRPGLCATFAALLFALPSRAQNRGANAPRPPAGREDHELPPLSKEDAELVKELALLEQLDLVRNLELFQPDKDEPPQQQRQQ